VRRGEVSWATGFTGSRVGLGGESWGSSWLIVRVSFLLFGGNFTTKTIGVGSRFHVVSLGGRVCAVAMVTGSAEPSPFYNTRDHDARGSKSWF
jgi:hypothetical protein